MKRTLLIIALLACACSMSAQVKKTPAKKPAPAKHEVTTEENIKEKSPVFPETMTLNIAAKYAKQLGAKMYNTDPVYGDKHTGYTFNIIGWKPIKGNEDKNYYFVKVETSWKEGMGGLFGDWKDVSYKGIMMIDEFGCGPYFFITEKQEFSVLGLVKRCHPLPTQVIQTMSAVDEWMKSIQYGWAPEGCLE